MIRQALLAAELLRQLQHADLVADDLLVSRHRVVSSLRYSMSTLGDDTPTIAACQIWSKRIHFIRTLKEQIVFGRIFQDIEDVRTAVRIYFDRYNQHWLLEKNGYRSPAETRRHWMAATITTQAAA